MCLAGRVGAGVGGGGGRVVWKRRGALGNSEGGVLVTLDAGYWPYSRVDLSYSRLVHLL